jgi:hypothetical protein
MAQPPLPSRTATSPDPVGAFRALIDLPLRQQFDPTFCIAINELSGQLRAVTPSTDWGPIYHQAIKVADDLLANTDRRLEDLQRRALTIEDPMEARNRLSQAPRREAERLRGEAKNTVQRVLREWIDRAKRQQDHVASGCVPLLRQNGLVNETATTHGLTLSLDKAWESQFTSYVSQCCDTWAQNFAPGVEQGLASGITQALVVLNRVHGNVNSPAYPGNPGAEIRFDVHVNAQDVEIPHVRQLALQSVQRAAGGGNPIGMILGLAVSASRLADARHQQEVLRERGVTAYRESAAMQFRAELDKVLDRHRRLLERWSTQRAEQWSAAVDLWWDSRVEPQLAQADAAAADQVRELKLQQSRMQEELSNLRSFRGQLSQTILFELRRRHRELAEAVQPK